jgi:short-subunit dehydrogenase
MPSNPFRENVVVITGASSGIGRAMALQLAEQGAWLALAARDIQRLEQVALECRGRGGRALAVQTDVSDQAQCQRLIERTLSEYGRIDTLVNNAGLTMWARFDELHDLDPLEQIMQINYFGSVYCTRAALPSLKQTHGRIVVVSSLTGKAGVPTRSGYAASKHALVGFFDSLRIELAGSGVSVTIVYPDFVATETRQRAFGPDGKPLGVSPVQEGKVMTAEECARLIIRATERRKREEVMGLRGKVGLWIKLIAPGLVDRIALRAIQRGR